MDLKRAMFGSLFVNHNITIHVETSRGTGVLPSDHSKQMEALMIFLCGCVVFDHRWGKANSLRECERVIDDANNTMSL